MISTLLDRLFQRSNVTSGAQVKQRLKFILAHDRAAIEPQIFDNMRHEIMRVVSKYVELDEGSLDIRLESDKRMTALIANLPIRTVREELPDLVSLFDEPSEDIQPTINTDAIALEMGQSAEEALDAIAAKGTTKTVPDNSTPEEIATIAERTSEVTNKLRTAANKPSIMPSIESEKLAEPDTLIEDTPKNKAQVILDRIEDFSAGQKTSEVKSQAESQVTGQVDVQVEAQVDDQADQLELSLNLPTVPESSLEPQEALGQIETAISENHSQQESA